MTRSQLTLFLDKEDAHSIERIRAKYNPEQYRLIKSHITLCREDEIGDMTTILNDLEELNGESFELEVYELARFSEGRGVLLKMSDKNDYFKNLRKLILKSTVINPRKHEPHITLMHPRNSTCNDMIFDEIRQTPIPAKFRFGRISLIQQELGEEWKLLAEFKLKS